MRGWIFDQALCTLDDYLRFRAVIDTELELSMGHILCYSEDKLLACASLDIGTYQALKSASVEIYERQIREALG